MKLLAVLLISGLLNTATSPWLNDYIQAKAEAAAKHEPILINFSGSDWCGPCIRMKKEIFEAESFQGFATQNLVLVNADFPRSKKNQLSREQTRKNEALAERYNKAGKFPLTLLVDQNGKVLKEWEGLPNETPERFVAEIKAIVDAAH